MACSLTETWSPDSARLQRPVRTGLLSVSVCVGGQADHPLQDWRKSAGWEEVQSSKKEVTG